MRIFEILCEGRDASLYHMMNAKKAESVFKNDTMYASHQHKLPSHGLIFGTSFTRFAQRWRKAFGSVWIEVDQTKLAQRHKIIPVDGEYVLGLKQGADDSNRFGDRIGGEEFAEEFVVGDINNLHLYVSNIMVLHTKEYRYLRPTEQASLDDTCSEYAKRWNIPL